MIARRGSSTRRLPLDGDGWSLTYVAHTSDPATDLGDARRRDYRTIDAVVPGSVELDLMRAGLLRDPYVGDALRDTWKLEYGDWWYRKEFTLPDDWDPQRTSLLLHGVDTIGDITLNGVRVGETRTMLVEHEFSLHAALRAGVNELVVHLRSPLLAAESFEYPAQYQQIWDASESLWIRKPGHMYGWDIAPRLVSAGLHRSVELLERVPLALSDWYLRTREVSASHATMELHYELSAAPRGAEVTLRIDGVHVGSGSRFSETAYPTFRSGRLSFDVTDPQLWFPRNYGEPALYDVYLTVAVDGVVVDTHRTRLGIRRIEVEIDLQPMPAGRFRVRVNGAPIMVLGTNWVPLDALHARDADRLPRALELLWDSGCNAVRCWGGNLYEDTPFFDWCDENGILVWQDFALACVRPPQDESFTDLVRAESESIVRKLRNHPSLFLWCGSNENDDSYVAAGLDPTQDALTRRVLPQAVRRHDLDTAYTPGSPAYTSEMVARGLTARAAEQHLWGDRASYKASFYSDSAAEFVSEIGFHGMPNGRALDRFLPDGHRAVDPDDPIWKLHETDHRAHPHGYYSRIELLLKQADLFCGRLDRADRQAIVAASQVSQAEAMKYFVERTRLQKGRSWGLMWWNLLDPWPQISDAVCDYWFTPKLAFHYLRRSQQPLCVVAGEAEGWTRPVVLLNDSSRDAVVHVEATTVAGGSRREFVVESPAGTNVPLFRADLHPDGDCHLFRWRVEGTGEVGGNHYLEGHPPFGLMRYREDYLPEIVALDSTFDLEDVWATS